MAGRKSVPDPLWLKSTVAKVEAKLMTLLQCMGRHPSLSTAMFQKNPSFEVKVGSGVHVAEGIGKP